MAPETQTSSASHSQPLTQPSASSSSSETWTSTELQSSLAHLAHLQAQLDALRSSIPSLVKPLKNAPTTSSAGDVERAKAAMFTGVRRAAEREGEALRALGEEWRGSRTQGVLRGVRESEAGDGDAGRAGEVRRWGWEEEGGEK